MIDGDCPPCQPLKLTREQEHERFRTEYTTPLVAYTDLRNTFLNINCRFFDHQVTVRDIESELRALWDELFQAVMILPHDSPEIDKLVLLVLEIKGFGVLRRTIKGDAAARGSGHKDCEGYEVARCSDERRIWLDLPWLVIDLQTIYISDELSAAQRNSLAAFNAKLCVAGIFSFHTASCGAWTLTNALGTNCSGELLEDVLPACRIFLDIANLKILEFCVMEAGRTITDGPTHAGEPMIPAPLTDQNYFSVKNWLLWRNGLGELMRLENKTISKMARHCFETMASTGRCSGIEIPGERRWLQRLFEALDKQVVTLGGNVCVDTSMIEVDPRWAVE
jgi:hypothetical protein